MTPRTRAAVLALLTLTACRNTTAPPIPQTLEDATKRFDQAIADLGWAQVDLWALGGRDIVVSVQLDTALAPHYFRLPRKAR